MHSRFFLFLALAAVVISCQEKSATAEKPPNIIFIMADDLGYSDIGAYGQQKIQTPHIDDLAAQGMKFTQFYAGSSVCAPSRASLMTGLHTGHTEVRGNKQYGRRNGQQPLSAGTTTLATVLKNQNYRTAIIGKWGLGDPNTTGNPLEQGFDHFYGYSDQVLAHNYYPEYLWRNNDRVYLRNEVKYLDSTEWHHGLGSYSTSQTDYSGDLFIQEALDFIQSNSESPFFLYLPVTTPHDNGEQVDSMRFEVPNQGIYADSDWSKAEKDYASMVTRLDEGVGKITGLLKKLRLEENTVVVFTSDNGPLPTNQTTEFFNSNGPFRGGKRDLYEGGVRVPFIISWPDRVEPQAVSNHVASFWDIMPTLAELAGTQVAKTDGISFVPELLSNKSQEKHEYLYWEFHEGDGKQGLRRGDFKAVRLKAKVEPNHPLELYNLVNDPLESNNIADKHPNIVSEMDSIMRICRTPSSLFPFGGENL